MSYIGSKGCVMIGDRRRIGFMGDEKRREVLEEMLYSGEITDLNQLYLTAKELGITLKITDDAEKVRKIDDVLVGEVKLRTPQSSLRKRVYGTTNGYQIIKLTGSNIDHVQEGNMSIVVFGNKITKKTAQESLRARWKKNLTIKEMVSIFRDVMEDLAQKTPSISPEYDVYQVRPILDKKNAMKLLRNTIVQDVKELAEWRAELREKLVDVARSMDIASRIMTEGVVGKVTKINGDEIEVQLGSGVVAVNTEWQVLAQKDDIILMKTNEPHRVQEGDIVVIKNEDLCISRTGSSLICEIILCNE